MRLQLLFLLFVTFATGVQGQDHPITVKRIGTEHGLSYHTVQALHQDRHGYIWVGTEDGLNRYDGYHFKVFKSDPYDSTTISDNGVFDITEDSKGRLWIATNKGLNRYNPITGNFKRYFPNPATTVQTAENLIRVIHPAASGKLWLGTLGGGLLLFDPDKNTFKTFKHIPADPYSLGDNFIQSIDTDKAGNVWIGTASGGLCFYDINKNTFKTYRSDKGDNSLSSNKIAAVHADEQGVIWIGTSDKGLNSLDPKTGSWKRYWHHGTGDGPGNNTIQRIFQLKSKPGQLLITTNNSGLFVLSKTTGAFTRYEHSPLDAKSLSHNSLSDILEDKNGNVWIASDVGINYFKTKASPVKLFQNNAAHPDLLSDNYVLSISEDREGYLWIGTKANGITRLDPSKRASYRQYTRGADKAGSLSSNYVQTLFRDSAGTMWAGTATGGLNEFDPATESFRVFSRNQTADQYPSYLNDIHTIAEDSRQNFWLGTHAGLVYFDRSNNQYITYLHQANDPASISSHIISKLLFTRDGTLWIGTFDGGLNKYEQITNTFTRFQHDPQKTSALSDNRICTLYEDNRGRLWIGTHNGLNLLDRATGKFSSFDMSHGLADNRIYGILEDDSGNLWLSTRNGISRFNPATGSVKNYTSKSGLQSNDFAGQLNMGAHYKAASGKLYFGGPEGFNEITPELAVINRHVPQVRITSVMINNKPLHAAVAVDELKKIKLGYNENAITFEFAALDYEEPEKNQYTYQLEGFDNGWTFNGNKRYATYTNLDPGEYIFRVRASNNDGIWNETGAFIKLTISPPFWLTWWAYGVYGLAIGTLVYAYWHYRLAQEKLKLELKLKQLEANKLQDLDQLKSDFFANISHEFRTPLTLILGSIEQLQAKREAAEGHRLSYYDVMKRNAQRLLQLINQLLDIAKLEAGTMKTDLKPVDLVQSLRIMLANFESYAESKQLTTVYTCDLDTLLVLADLDKLQKIIYNLLINAFDHTPSGGEIRLSLLKTNPPTTASGKTNEGWFKICVEDSGVGIAASKLKFLFDRFYQVDNSRTRKTEGAGIGLALAKELVDLLGGSIAVTSQEGRGTCFCIHLPFTLSARQADAPNTEPELTLMPPVFSTEAENSKRARSTQPMLLLIEDNADMRWYIRAELEANFSIVEAADGKSGLEKAIALIPDVIISDLMMPELDGLELCRLLKTDEKTSHIPVILLTAKANSDSKLTGFEYGADDYITKPFCSKELKARVKNLLKQRQLLRQKYSRDTVLQPAAISVNSADERFLSRAISLVEEHISDPGFNVESFCKEIGMSRMQLHRKITSLTGQSSSEFIRNIRLQRAAALLHQGWGSIAEVAYETGFENLSYFSKCFKDVFGQTPSQYNLSHHPAMP